MAPINSARASTDQIPCDGFLNQAKEACSQMVQLLAQVPWLDQHAACRSGQPALVVLAAPRPRSDDRRILVSCVVSGVSTGELEITCSD